MKKSIKLIVSMIIGIIIGITCFTYAGNYNSNEITYDNSTSGSTKTNVKDAVDELYSKSSLLSLYKLRDEGITNGKRCIRAKTLHTEGVKTFGSIGIVGTLTSGDAFDCDVNRDGTYNATNERFYYVADLASDSNKAVLIYYSNTNVGVADPTKKIAYNSANVNNLGPVTAISDLPSTSQWVTTITNPRQITNENGGTTTSAGTIVSYNYGDRAARLLTTQEVSTACNKSVSEMNSQFGLPDTCNYLIENTNIFNKSFPNGFWLETPLASDSTSIWKVGSTYGSWARYVSYSDANSTNNSGARPAIEVLKSDISY